MRRLIGASLLLVLFLVLGNASVVLAHDSMDPQELGPPLLISLLLGAAGYVAMVWDTEPRPGPKRSDRR